jgi:hypothetical protein
MDERTLKRLLRATDRPPDQPGWGCPTETQLEAYFDERVFAAERAGIEAHLSDCDRCLEQIAFLARLPVSEPQDAVAPDLLAKAKGLVSSRQRPWLAPALRWGAVAAAACLVLAVGLNWRAPSHTDVPRAVRPAIPEAPPPPSAVAVPLAPPVLPPATVRKSPESTSQVVIVSPQEKATLSAHALEFTWRAVPSALYYEVRVTTEDGTVVWQAKADATSVRLPADRPLRPGAGYFVSVRAYLAGGGSVLSAWVSFQVGAS